MMSLEGDLVFTKRFVDCVKKPHSDRTPEDHDYICHTLRKLSEFEFYDSTQFKCVPDRLIYELHLKDTIIYEAGALADCWYCVLTGSVMLSDTYLFSTGSSFGRCINSDQRDDRCHILEKTELLRINYSEEEMKRFAQRAAKMASKSPKASVDLTTSGEHSLSTSQVSTTAASTKAEDTVPPSGMTEGRSENVSLLNRRKGSDGLELELHVTTSTPPPDSSGSPRRAQVYPMSADILSDRDSRSISEERSPFFSFEETKKSMSNDSLNKAMEHPVTFDLERAGGGIPTSSEVVVRSRDRRRERRASAPPTDHRIRDSVGSLDYLSESQVDSDDEESVQSESSSATSMDAVLEVLSKPPTDRSEEDIERVMDVLQYIPAFTNMTSNIRQALFQILMLQTFENEGSIVIDNGEEVNKWYVVLNGQLRLVRDSDTDRTYHVGDSFGINQSLKVLPQRGKLLTAEKSCTLCFVTLEEYSRVQIQGEENLKRVEVGGELVAVLEKRAVDAKREGYFIVQATPEELLKNLCEETVDDLFMKDFLLTYKTFLPSPLAVVDQLKKAWVEGLPEQRERVTVILTYWVAEQYSEFEEMTEMLDFLDWFEIRLVEDGKLSEKKTVDKLRSSRAATRSIELDRAGTNSPLEFEVVGGWEVGHPVFVSKVDPGSMSEKAGLRLGDQILEINDAKCIKKELNQVLSTLRKNYKLSLKVKSNLPEFRTFVADPPKVPADYSSKSPAPAPMVPHIPMARCNSDSKPAATNGKTSIKTPSSPKPKKKGPHIMKPLTAFTGKLSSLDKFRKFKLGSRSSTSAIVSSDSHDSTTGPAPLKAMKGKRKARKNSTENLSVGKGDKGRGKKGAPLRASSMEDIHSLSSPGGNGKGGTAGKIVDAVVKLYLPDHSHKYLDICPSTTIAELISRAVKEFYPDKFVVSPSSEYCICMVTVDSRNGPIRNSVLPYHMTDLANHIGLGSRYYLKERGFHGTLVQDEEAEHIVKESRLWEHILSLSPKQVAEELTRADSVVFCSIDSREYIADLWRNRDQQAKQNLSKFENIPNDEMYWVVTMIVSETRSDMRAKLMKQFIKIARCCRDQRNYNSMFHILSGLHHGLVSRQKSSWEKVPSKHKKSMEDMSSFMNPFHNMAKYRELQRSTPPPLIPFFPIIKKDLTFLFDGNESQVKGLVNFEKLRMLARQIRLIKTYCQQPIIPDPPQVDLGKLGGMLKSIHHSIRLRNKSTNMATITDNVLKDVYTHHRMLKMVRKHLERKYVVQEEDLLERIAESSERVVQLRRNPPSPLNRVKRKSAPNDKYSNFNNFKPISPSPTTTSLGSDTSAAHPVDGFTPPSSPRRQLSVPASALASDSQSSSSVSVSPSLNDSAATEANGLVQAVQ